MENTAAPVAEFLKYIGRSIRRCECGFLPERMFFNTLFPKISKFLCSFKKRDKIFPPFPTWRSGLLAFFPYYFNGIPHFHSHQVVSFSVSARSPCIHSSRTNNELVKFRLNLHSQRNRQSRNWPLKLVVEISIVEILLECVAKRPSTSSFAGSGVFMVVLHSVSRIQACVHLDYTSRKAQKPSEIL